MSCGLLEQYGFVVSEMPREEKRVSVYEELLLEFIAADVPSMRMQTDYASVNRMANSINQLLKRRDYGAKIHATVRKPYLYLVREDVDDAENA